MWINKYFIDIFIVLLLVLFSFYLGRTYSIYHTDPWHWGSIASNAKDHINGFKLFKDIVLDVNFLTAGTPGIEKGDTIGLNFNFSNKILIISSIVFFHLIPFLINKKFLNNLSNLINKKLLIFIVIFFYD